MEVLDAESHGVGARQMRDTKGAEVGTRTLSHVKQTVAPLVQPLDPMIAPLRFGIIAQLPGKYLFSSLSGSNSANGTPTTVHPVQGYQTFYRGSFPRSRHLPFLSRLRLKAILSLTPKPIEAVDSEVAQWCKEQGVLVHHIRCDKPKDDGGGLSREGAAQALTIVLDNRNLPLYAHCLDGQSISTLLVAVVRKVQAWSTPSIQNEMIRWLGRDEEILSYQLAFLDKFGKPDGVRLPPRRFMPEWTWQEPSPLRRLRNPYDIIAVKEKPDKNLTPASMAAAAAAASVSESPSSSSGGHKRQTSIDAMSTTSSSASTQPSAITTQYSTGALPVQHPTLKLKFDVDLNLPPPPQALLSSHTPHSGHSRESSMFLSPSPSRPTSRAGRSQTHHNAHAHPFHTHAYQQAGDSSSRASSRASSRPSSPPRRRPMPSSDSQTTPDAKKALNGSAEAKYAELSSPDHSFFHRQSESSSSRVSSRASSSTASSPRMDNDTLLVPQATRGMLSANDFLHQPHVHSHLNDSFYSSSMSQSVTPRASISHFQPHGLAGGRRSPTSLGAQSGLGLHEEDSREAMPRAHDAWPLAQDGLNEHHHDHPALLRSISDQYNDRPHSRSRQPSNLSTPQQEGGLEYFSEPESIEEDDQARERKQDVGEEPGTTKSGRRHSSHSRGTSAKSEQEDDDRVNEEEEEDVGADEVEEEEEESEEEEEEEEEDGASDDLALEALDLEGY